MRQSFLLPLAVLSLNAALSDTAQAQSVLLSNMSATATTDVTNYGKQFLVSEAYFTSPKHIIELNDQEAVVMILDNLGKKQHTAVVLDGKLSLPAELAGMIYTLDMVGEQAHQTFELAIREADDYIEFNK